MTDRHAIALRRAAGLTAATVVWNLSVGITAVTTAVATGSLALIGFGVNAVVDSSVSSLLVWRFRAAASGRSEHAEAVERLAVRVAGAAFTIIAVYLSVRGHCWRASGQIRLCLGSRRGWQRWPCCRI